MTWVRIDDTFPEHPKVLEAGGDAGWLHVCALAYCARILTDGLIPRNAVARLSDRKHPIKLADRLVDAGIWDRDGDNYRIHDYLEYNPSRAEVETQRAARSEAKSKAGKQGGIASGVTRRRNAKHNRSTIEAEMKQPGSEGEANGKRIEAPTRPDPSRPLDIQVSRQTDSLDTQESVVCRALELYADAQTPGPHVVDAVKWRRGVIRNARTEHAATINGNPDATDIELAGLMLGTASDVPRPPREAWYPNPHCETCDGTGLRVVDDGGAGTGYPCDCRRPEPYLADVIEFKQATA